MYVDEAGRRIVVKIVYRGAPGAGVRTSLRGAHAAAAGGDEELTVVEAGGDRTVISRLEPEWIEPVGGLAFRCEVYGPPTAWPFEAARAMALQGADAVVFVADSSPSAADDNARAMAEFIAGLERAGLVDAPVVIAANKRDLATAAPFREVVDGLALACGAEDVFETVATAGSGLLEAFREACERAVDHIRGMAG